jgi:hypothetical protein
MPRFQPVHQGLKLLPVDVAKQSRPGSFEWGWRRFPPQSALPQWYEQRFGPASSRWRRIGSVAWALHALTWTQHRLPAGGQRWFLEI